MTNLGDKVGINTLVYDRDCELCCWGRDWVKRWDRAGRIAFLAFQEPRFRESFPDLDRSDPDGIWPEGMPPRAMLFIDRDGKAWSGIDAFRKMLPRLPAGKVLFLLFFIPGVPLLAAWFYEWVARNRYRWFGYSRGNNS